MDNTQETMNLIYKDLEDSICNYIDKHHCEPSNILIHTEHQRQLIDNIKAIVYRFIPDESKPIKYRGVNVLTSDKIKFGDIICS